MTENMPLSKHFKFSELIKTSHSEFAAEQRAEALKRWPVLLDLCNTILEPTRAILGVPMIITSGYRCLGLNQKIGGSLTSQHSAGEAADFVPVGMSVAEAFDRLSNSAVPFGQLIFERTGKTEWVHISLGYPYRAAVKSGQVLKIIDGKSIFVKQNKQ